jgi:hypothetical protein
MVEGKRTEDLALTRVGAQGPADAEINRSISAGRRAGISFWEGRIGRALDESEEDAIVVLADGLARARRDA